MGQKKSRKIPAKFPANFPPKNQKSSPTSFCRSAGRTIRFQGQPGTKITPASPSFGGELSVPLSLLFMCQSELTKFFQNSPGSLFRNSALETVFRLFPNFRGYSLIGNGPNTVSESTVSNTELSEFLSAYYLCAKANSPSFSQNSPSLPRNSVSSLLRNSTLETVFRPFPI